MRVLRPDSTDHRAVNRLQRHDDDDFVVRTPSAPDAMLSRVRVALRQYEIVTMRDDANSIVDMPRNRETSQLVDANSNVAVIVQRLLGDCRRRVARDREFSFGVALHAVVVLHAYVTQAQVIDRVH